LLVLSTSVTITAGDAMRIAANERMAGLIERAIAVLLMAPDRTRAQEARLIYCPLYAAIVKATFKRPLIADERVHLTLVVDGWRGEASMAFGYPQTTRLETHPDQIVPTRITEEEAAQLALKEAERFAVRRWRKVPGLQLLDMAVIYKPNWVVLCERGAVRHYRFVDAETGIIVYRYDREVGKLKELVPAITDL